MIDHPSFPKNPTIADVQAYIAKVMQYRKHNDEIVFCLLMLCEEVGELAKAVRKTSGAKIDPLSRDAHVDEEAADVLFVLLAICNAMGVDLEQAFRKKEAINATRVWK